MLIKKRLFVVLMMTLALLVGLASNVYAEDLSQCMNCHLIDAQPTADVTKFKLPAFVDGSMDGSTVDKTACVVCHWTDIGQQHWPTFSTVVVTVYDNTFGGFKTTESIYMATAKIHDLHYGPKRSVGSSCIRCHGVVSCYTCHKSVPHDGHYTGTGINPKTNSSIATPVLTVVNGSSTIQETTSCAAAECHQTLNVPPKRYNNDGTQLCLNCHYTDKAGHSETQLATAHTTTFNQTLIAESNNEPINCTSCHSSGLREEHYNNSTDCYACHSSTTPLEVKAVIDGANGVETNRACEKCHFNMNVLPLRPPSHPLDHIAEQSNGLSVVGGPHATCNTCHARTEILGTIRTLAYSNPKDYSCLSCHTGGTYPKAPVHKADYNGQLMAIMDVHTSCTSCHTPGTDYAVKVDTIAAALKADPAGTYSCTECHTNLSSGHQATFDGLTYTDTTAFHLKCTDCHNDSYKTTVASLKEQVKLGLNYDCSACHMVTNSKGVSPYYPVHQAGNDGIVGFHPLSCESCHKVYNGQYNINLDPMRAQLPTPGYSCADCHNGTVTASGLVANAPYHQATDSNGTVYNTTDFHSTCGTCHDSTNTTVVTTIDTRSGTTTPYPCADCHTGGLAPLHTANWTDGTAYDTTGFHKDCAQCHSNTNLAVGDKIHAINTGVNGGTITSYTCAECHNNTIVPEAQHQAQLTTATAVYETTSFHVKLTTVATESCFQCHGNSLVTTDMATIFTKVKGGSGYLCTDCHNNGTAAPYTPSHTAVLDAETFDTLGLHQACTSCHTTSYDTEIRTLKGQSGYDCQTCHVDVSTAHVSPTVLTGGMIDCSWCHTTDLVDTHLTPPVTLAKTMQCTTCHGSVSPVKTQIQLGQKECAQCHDGVILDSIHPGKQYVPRHTAVFPSFLPEYSPNCVNCHSGSTPGTVPTIDSLHSNYLVGCSECHNDATFKPAVTSLSTNCTGCHSDAVKVGMDMTESHKVYHNANTTLYPETVDCLGCHAKDTTVDGQSLLGVHKKDTASTVTCDTCHSSTARQEVKDAITANNVNCQACHATTSGHQHPVAVNGYAPTPNVDCTKCHATAADGTAELAAIHKDAADRGKITNYSCATCHNTTFEGTAIPKDGSLDMLKNGIPIYCTDCHNGNLTDALGTKYPEHDGTHDNATGFGTYKWESGVDCSKCHTNMSVAPTHDSANPQDVTCNSCHTSNNAEVINVIKANWSRAAVPAGFTCADCHNTLASSNHAYEHQATGTDPVTCNTCHDGTTVVGLFNAPNGTAVNVTGIHTSNNCNTCHTSSNTTVQQFINSKIGLANSVYTCENCHDSITPKHNKMHTVTAFTSDGATGCANCHNADVVAQHSESFKAGLNCDTCHGANAATVLPNTPTVVKANLSSNLSRAGYTCTDCHGAVSHQHQVGKNGYKASAETECSSCHATDATTGEAELAQLHQDQGFGCAACHNSTFEGTDKVITGDGNLNMNRNGQTIYCNDCHNGTLTNTVESGHAPEHQAKHSATNMDCSSCHGFTLTAGTAADIKSTSIHSGGCYTCHSDTTRSDVKLIVAAKTGLTNPVYNCEDCHGTIHFGWETKHQPTFPSDPNMDCANCHNNYLPTEHTKYFESTTDSTNASVAYKVFRSDDGTSWSQVGTTTGTNFSIGSLTPSTTYWFKVQAYDAAGNLSNFSNTASASTKEAPVSSGTVSTLVADDARWSYNNDGDSTYDKNLYDATSRLKDSSDSSDYEIRNDGSDDKWVYMKVNKDAKDYSKIKVKLRFRWDETDSYGNMLIYPYKSDGKYINTSDKVDYKMTKPSTSYTWYEIDVTNAARTMDGFGWIKFRIKPGSDGSRERADLSEVRFVLETPGGTTTESSTTTTSTDITTDTSGTDTVPPTDPTSLTAAAYNSAQIDLAWTGSTDSTGTSTDGEAATCVLCHSSTARTEVQTAVQNNNANCSACHTIHGDITTEHTAPAYGFSGYSWNCGKCHTLVLSDEHANRGLTCSTCHDSTKTKVQEAINNQLSDGSNRKCSNCHTGTTDGAGAIHTDITTPHLEGIFPTATDFDCLGCHNQQRAEFDPSMGSYHMVGGLTTTTASGKGAYINGWTYNSLVGCMGCHGDLKDGKAQKANILKRPYTYTSGSEQPDMLCYLCHDYRTYGGGSESDNNTGFLDSGKNAHNIGDHEVNNRVQCSWCHAAVPHATARQNLIVVQGEPNSAGNIITNYTLPSSGSSYSERNCGSDHNECDDHKGY